MNDPSTIWEILGLSPTGDAAAIRRAYASKLRTTRPEDDREGFTRLRAAYEAALAQAAAPRVEHPAQPPAHIPWPAETVIRVTVASGASPRIRTRLEYAADGTPITPVDSPPRTAGDPALQTAAALGTALHSLRMALRPDAQVSEAERLALLRQVLDLAKAGTVMSERDAERDLTAMLIANTPRSDPLFEELVHQLQLQGREPELVCDPLMRAVLAHHEAQLLAPLRSGKHPLADAFARLSGPADPWQRWWRAHVSLEGRWPEVELLTLLDEGGHRRVIGELHEAEVAWWRSFAAGPKLSQTLVLIGRGVVLPLTGVALFVASNAGMDRHYLSELLLVPPAYIALLLAKLYVIDWPTHLVARRPASLPLTLQAGWLPLLAAAWAAALLPPAPLVPRWGTALLGAVGCLWALYVSPPAPVLTPSRALHSLALNGALAIWGLEAAAELGAPPWRIPLEAFAGAAWLLCASGLGLEALRAAWTRVAEGKRTTCLLLLTACGIGVAGVLATASAPGWQPLQVWLVVSFVAVHRAALDYRSAAVVTRLIVLVLCIYLAQAILVAGQIEISAPTTRAGGLVLVVAALWNLLLAPGWPTGVRRA